MGQSSASLTVPGIVEEEEADGLVQNSLGVLAKGYSDQSEIVTKIDITPDQILAVLLRIKKLVHYGQLKRGRVLHLKHLAACIAAKKLIFKFG